MKIVLVVVAIVCFVLGAVGVAAFLHAAWIPLGLAIWASSTLVK